MVSTSVTSIGLRTSKALLLATLLFLGVSSQAFANAGLPMIMLTFPAMLIGLLPVIFVESLIFKRSLKIPLKMVLVPNSVANATSTLVGLPLSWGVLFVLELLTTGGSCGPGFETVSSSIITAILESAWLCPWEDQMFWLIPVAFVNGLLAAFLISLFIEYLIMRKMLTGYDNHLVKKLTYKSNIISYSLLVVLSTSYLVYNMVYKS